MRVALSYFICFAYVAIDNALVSNLYASASNIVQLPPQGQGLDKD